jgi:FkbH-like protein
VATRLQVIEQQSGPYGASLQHLATSRLSSAQSARIGRFIEKMRASGRGCETLASFRLGVVSNATLDLVLPSIPAAAIRHGVVVDVVTTPYDQVEQQVLDPRSTINAARCDAVLVALDYRGLQFEFVSNPSAAAERVSATLNRFRNIVEALRLHGGAPAIIQTIPTPAVALFGNYERRVAGSVRSLLEEVNRGLVSLAAETGCYIFDVAALAERIGTDAWFDPVHWAAYKLPFAADCELVYADMLGRLLGSIRGKSRKCLVLDLDNTIWGGVIGDDGVEGIKIGQGNALGEAFLAVQSLALALRDRGVILAVCSKNTEEIARQPFRNHPDMLLKETDISVFQANWLDKASNLEAIAKKLNIGLDTLVLLDDNPAERAQVRAALPMVGVPELPADPSWYPWYLASAGYFEATTYSSEDALRSASYAADGQRAEVMAKARNLGDYLTSLDMAITMTPFDERSRQRITQLINKTNQFNLTTRRYTEAEVAACQNDPRTYTLQVRLQDKFGDLGMIGVIIGRLVKTRSGNDLVLDTWLMSCRVLGRKVEEAMLAEVTLGAKNLGADHLIGRYLPTAKNTMVSDHYSKLGFEQLSKREDGVLTFRKSTVSQLTEELPFRPGPAKTQD